MATVIFSLNLECVDIAQFKKLATVCVEIFVVLKFHVITIVVLFYNIWGVGTSRNSLAHMDNYKIKMPSGCTYSYMQGMQATYCTVDFLSVWISCIVYSVLCSYSVLHMILWVHYHSRNRQCSNRQKSIVKICVYIPYISMPMVSQFCATHLYKTTMFPMIFGPLLREKHCSLWEKLLTATIHLLWHFKRWSYAWPYASKNTICSLFLRRHGVIHCEVTGRQRCHIYFITTWLSHETP